MIRIGHILVPEGRIKKVDCSRLESNLSVKVSLMDSTLEYELRGADAVDLVMRVCPSWFEGQRLKWLRHKWALHNLVGHPLLQILSWVGLTKLGLRVHDATVPRPLVSQAPTQGSQAPSASGTLQPSA